METTRANPNVTYSQEKRPRKEPVLGEGGRDGEEGNQLARNHGSRLHKNEKGKKRRIGDFATKKV